MLATDVARLANALAEQDRAVAEPLRFRRRRSEQVVGACDQTELTGHLLRALAERCLKTVTVEDRLRVGDRRRVGDGWAGADILRPVADHIGNRERERRPQAAALDAREVAADAVDLRDRP